MCSEPEDLRRRAFWDGAAGTSRQRLLNTLHSERLVLAHFAWVAHSLSWPDFIPSSTMIPQKRFQALIEQALEYQRHRCLYHNVPSDDTSISLFSDHHCSSSDFPTVTTTVLEVHEDEVWNIEWSHDGKFLASASKDKSAIIWRAGVRFVATANHCFDFDHVHSQDSASSTDWKAHAILKNHPYPVGSLAWSIDDSVLLTSAEQVIMMWDAKVSAALDLDCLLLTPPYLIRPVNVYRRWRVGISSR